MPTTQAQVDAARGALPGLANDKVTTTQDVVAKASAATSKKNAWTLSVSAWQTAVTARANGTGTQAAVDSAFADMTAKEALYTAAGQDLAAANAAKSQALSAFDSGVTSYQELVTSLANGT